MGDHDCWSSKRHGAADPTSRIHQVSPRTPTMSGGWSIRHRCLHTCMTNMYVWAMYAVRSAARLEGVMKAHLQVPKPPPVRRRARHGDVLRVHRQQQQQDIEI